jgi:hypothetical protein
VGVDGSGTRFDGTYQPAGDSIDVTMEVSAPPNLTLIQGTPTGPEGLTYPLSFRVPGNFAEASFLPISTPLGPVNVRLEKLRTL